MSKKPDSSDKFNNFVKLYLNPHLFIFIFMGLRPLNPPPFIILLAWNAWCIVELLNIRARRDDELKFVTLGICIRFFWIWRLANDDYEQVVKELFRPRYGRH